MLINNIKRMQGTSLAETLIIMPIFLMLTLGAVQYGLIYEAKSSLDYATFMSARAGSVDHAKKQIIMKGLATSLAPLYSPDTDTPSLIATVAKARVDLGLFSQVKILNPTKEAFNDFGVKNTKDNVTEIPNEMLHLEKTTVGSTSKVNIQDANLLKLQVLYGYKLKVPFANSVISTVSSWFTRDPVKLAYLSQKRLPILATATVRMQSRIWDNNLVTKLADVDKAVTDSGNPPAPLVLAKITRPWNSGPTGQGNPSNVTIGNPGNGGGLPGGGGGSSGGGNTGSDPLCKLLGTCNGTGNGNPGNSCKVKSQPSATSLPNSLPSISASNPINVVTGNKYQHETDMRPLPGKLGLEFTRSYNSQTDYNQFIGFGWSHSYDINLSNVTDETINLRQSDGRVIVFTHIDSGSYSPPLVSDGYIDKLDNGYNWNWPSGRVYEFTSTGRLERIRDNHGNVIQLYYTEDNYLLSVIDALKRQINFNYDDKGRISALSDPTGLKTHYSYDEIGNLVKVLRGNQTEKTYHYENKYDQHNLTGITDERGVRVANYSYDENDRAILSEHANHVIKVKIEYLDDGIRKITNSTGQKSTYYTAAKNGIPHVLKIEGPGCSTCGEGDIKYEYNENIQLVLSTNKNGIVKKYEYDNNARLESIKTIVDGKEELLLAYSYAGNSMQPNGISRPSINSTGSYKINVKRTQSGRVKEIVESGFSPVIGKGYKSIVRTTSLKYINNNLVEIDGPRDDVKDIIRIAYDTENRLEKISYPDGSSKKILEYDSYGRPVKVAVGNDDIIDIEYDYSGQIKLIKSDDQWVSYKYNETGELEKISKSDGQSINIEYDSALRVIGINQDNGASINVDLDTENRITKSTIMERGTLEAVTYLYDAYSRLKTTRSSDGGINNIYHYDSNDDLVKIQDKNGNSQKYSYGNTVSSIINPLHAKGKTPAAGDDAGQRLSQFTDKRNNETLYLQDDFGRLVATMSPDEGLRTFEYDKSGNVIKETNAEGQSTSYQYDAANRVIMWGDYEGTTRLTYGVNDSRIREIKSPDSAESYDYDYKGRVKTHTRNIDGKTFISKYAYRDDGKLQEKILPDGQTLLYHYYETGEDKDKLRAVTRKDFLGQTTIVGEIQYGKYGIEKYTHGNGIVSSYVYDTTGQLLTINAEQALKIHYYYDEQGRISKVTENGINQDFAYDSLGRLSYASMPKGVMEYTYDEAGNRISESLDGIVNEYIYTEPSEGNQLLQAGDTNYDYNSAGSPVSIGNLIYEYNTDQRPVKVFKDDKLIAEYQYNSIGERIKKSIYDAKGKNDTYYLYNPAGELIAEANENGDITHQYVFIDDYRPIANLQGSSIYAMHTDRLGTPRKLTNNDSNVVWSTEQDPFGKTTIIKQQVSMNLRFPGQYYDAETGTHYNYLRDYDPETGRYLTTDPIGIEGGVNLFAYVNNNPLINIDPTGESIISYFLKKGAKKIGVKHFKQYINDVVKKDIRKSFPKGSKDYKELMKEADELVDKVVNSGGSWFWDAFEWIPIAGDICSGVRLSKKLKAIDKAIEKLEKKIAKKKKENKTKKKDKYKNCSGNYKKIPGWPIPLCAAKGRRSGQWSNMNRQGNSDWLPHKTTALYKYLIRNYNTNKVTFRNGYPVFKPFVYKDPTTGRLASVRIEGMKGDYGTGPDGDFGKARFEYGKRLGLSDAQARKWIEPKGWTWHHHQNGKTMMLIPTPIHKNVRHRGGCSVCKANVL